MDEFITLRRAAEIAGYGDHSLLRQAAARGKMRIETRESEVGHRHGVTTLAWLLDYLENRPEWAQEDGRADRVREYIEKHELAGVAG